MSSKNLNSYKLIYPYQSLDKNIIISQSNEQKKKQDSVFKYQKNKINIKENNNYREISTENNYFQLFGLNSNKLREIFLDHGESIIKWKNDNS